MSKTWVNHECEFYSNNTENNLGNTRYLVASNNMVRTAKVNLIRAPDQVLHDNPSICYIEENSDIYDAVMQQGDDTKITISSVNGNVIIVKVSDVQGPNGNYVLGSCSRIPVNGLCTFDFNNNNGVLTGVHVGHAIMNINHGRPNPRAVFDRVVFEMKMNNP